MLFSDFIYLNALSKAFWVATSFFHQNFCTSSVPGAIPLFLLLTSFFSFFVSLSNSFITKTFLPSNLFTSSIQSTFGVLSFSSQTAPQNSTNFSISDIFPSRVWSPSNILKKPFWLRLNLSCFLFLFSIHFSNLTFLYLNLSIHCSFVILILLKVSSLPILRFTCFKISFSFFVAFLLTFFLKSSLLVLATHCRSPFISFFNFRFYLFSPLASFYEVPFCSGCFFSHCINLSVILGMVFTSISYLLRILFS